MPSADFLPQAEREQPRNLLAHFQSHAASKSLFQIQGKTQNGSQVPKPSTCTRKAKTATLPEPLPHFQAGKAPTPTRPRQTRTNRPVDTSRLFPQKPAASPVSLTKPPVKPFALIPRQKSDNTQNLPASTPASGQESGTTAACSRLTPVQRPQAVPEAAAPECPNPNSRIERLLFIPFIF